MPEGDRKTIKKSTGDCDRGSEKTSGEKPKVKTKKSSQKDKKRQKEVRGAKGKSCLKT